MSSYIPDGWALIKAKLSDETTLYKVLGSWSGGYLSGDSWRINSGITSYEDLGEYVSFKGNSSSKYLCHKSGENRLNFMTVGVLDIILDSAEERKIEASTISLKDFLEEFENE